MIKISIIIPVYNVENYIRKTLESIVAQTIGLEYLEVMMVDDCSTDGSGEIIDEYASKYENFNAIHLPQNSGAAGKPRNIGMERSTGEYLMFLDSDDYYAHDACEILYNKISQEDADIVFCNYIYVLGNRTHKPRNPFKDRNIVNAEKIAREPDLFKIPPSIWTKIFRRKFITDNEIHFPEGIPTQDLVFLVHAFLEAKGIIYLNNYYGNYYNRTRDLSGDTGISRSYSLKNMMGMVQAYYQTFDILKKHQKEEYFPLIFEGHLQFWVKGFISSDLNPSERKMLLVEASPLFEEFLKYDVKPHKDLEVLFNNIGDKRFGDSINLSERLHDYKEPQIKKLLKKIKSNLLEKLKLE